MDSLPHSLPTSSPSHSSPPSYSATEDASNRRRSTSLEMPRWQGSRTRRDSLEVERERRQRRATLWSTSSSSSSPPGRSSVSPFNLPSPLSPSHSSRREGESEWRTSSPLESGIHEPAPIRSRSAAFLQGDVVAGCPPPPPYRPQSPNDYLGVVERWEEVPNPNFVAPGSVAAHVSVQEGEEVPTAEHVEYADGYRIPWAVDRVNKDEGDPSTFFPHDSRLGEDMPTFAHIEYCLPSG